MLPNWMDLLAGVFGPRYLINLDLLNCHTVFDKRVALLTHGNMIGGWHKC